MARRGFGFVIDGSSLYFINPTGHSLKALDLVTMKHLDSKVNIIPIIAKSDTISKNELQRFKQNILNELNTAGVKIYRFPTDDETLAEDNLKANVNRSMSPDSVRSSLSS